MNPLVRLLRFLARQLLIAAPFAVFFSVIFGRGIQGLPSFYIASSVFSLAIGATTSLNHRWVVPRLLPKGRAEEGRPLILEISSYAAAAMIGSLLAALLLQHTIAPGILTSPRAVTIFVTFTLLFCALFLGLIYSVRFQRRFVERVRAEAESQAREEQEMKVAGEIQRALLPGRPHATRQFAAAGAALACRTIGGDFFDYFELPGGRLGFALGDVAGKGPPAALLAAMVQGIFTSHVDDGHGPAGTIEHVNRVLAQRIVEGRFATIFYAVLSPDGTLVSCNAGNNPPLLMGADGSVSRLTRGGLPMGPFPEATFEEERTSLAPGDTLVLYSDGVSDATDPDNRSFGEERLIDSLSRGRLLAPEALIDHMLADIRAFALGHPQFDDITLLVVRYAGA